MTLEQLRVLVAVVEAKSFKKASQMLNRSQPAVSVAIRNLEEEIGTELFSRSHYRAVMMAEGMAFFEQARKLVADAEHLANFGRYLAKGYEKEVRLAIDSIYPLEQLSVLLRACKAEMQESLLTVSMVSLEKGIKEILDMEIDIAIGFSDAKHAEVEEVKLREVTMVPVHAKILSAVDNPVDPLSSRSFPQIMISDEPVRAKMLSQEYGGVAQGNQWKVTDFHTKKILIREGFGWGYLPQYSILSELEDSSLVRIRSKSINTHAISLKAFRKIGGGHGKISTELWKVIRAQGMS